MKPIRNRIIEHVQVRAGDLLPHPLNWRRHPKAQRDVLAASLHEVGFARSLLGYRLQDGRIQLIDGHLRRDFDPEMPVTVELVDVNDEEARKLLLTLDPLAELAEKDDDVLAELNRRTKADEAALNELWKSLEDAKAVAAESDEVAEEPLPEKYMILVECDDEAHQTELLRRFAAEGINCRALIS